ncbi:MAG TPA: acyltransferase [Thermomonospora sp.]|nr:acyltransferase [Thermomonospora sp.]
MSRRAARDTAAAQRLVALDLLRFVAATSVMLFHYVAIVVPRFLGDYPREVFPELTWLRFGGFGVDLFFMISGFVILMSVWGRRPSDFLLSRVTRLFPAYWFSVVLSVAVFAATGLEHGYGPKADGVYLRFLPNLTMLQEGVGAPAMEELYWTLWVELHFYALIGVLVFWDITYSRCVAFMSGWLVLSAFATEVDSALLETVLISRWAPYFIAGMAFYLIHRFGSNLVCWLLVAFCWALMVRHSMPVENGTRWWPGVHEWACPGIVTAIFVAMALVATGRLGWIRWRGLTTLGALTYPVYLVHMIVLRVVGHYWYPELGRWPVLALCVGTSLLIAYACHRWIERPGGRWLRRRLVAALEGIRQADARDRAAVPERV